ncbi:hypothetical protein SNEBB_006768, partial [Seison nebaliae]
KFKLEISDPGVSNSEIHYGESKIILGDIINDSLDNSDEECEIINKANEFDSLYLTTTDMIEGQDKILCDSLMLNQSTGSPQNLEDSLVNVNEVLEEGNSGSKINDIQHFVNEMEKIGDEFCQTINEFETSIRLANQLILPVSSRLGPLDCVSETPEILLDKARELGVIASSLNSIPSSIMAKVVNATKSSDMYLYSKYNTTIKSTNQLYFTSSMSLDKLDQSPTEHLRLTKAYSLGSLIGNDVDNQIYSTSWDMDLPCKIVTQKQKVVSSTDDLVQIVRRSHSAPRSSLIYSTKVDLKCDTKLLHSAPITPISSPRVHSISKSSTEPPSTDDLEERENNQKNVLASKSCVFNDKIIVENNEVLPINPSMTLDVSIDSQVSEKIFKDTESLREFEMLEDSLKDPKFKNKYRSSVGRDNEYKLSTSMLTSLDERDMLDLLSRSEVEGESAEFLSSMSKSKEYAETEEDAEPIDKDIKKDIQVPNKLVSKVITDSAFYSSITSDTAVSDSAKKERTSENISESQITESVEDLTDSRNLDIESIHLEPIPSPATTATPINKHNEAFSFPLKLVDDVLKFIPQDEYKTIAAEDADDEQEHRALSRRSTVGSKQQIEFHQSSQEDLQSVRMAKSFSHSQLQSSQEMSLLCAKEKRKMEEQMTKSLSLEPLSPINKTKSLGSFQIHRPNERISFVSQEIYCGDKNDRRIVRKKKRRPICFKDLLSETSDEEDNFERVTISDNPIESLSDKMRQFSQSTSDESKEKQPLQQMSADDTAKIRLIGNDISPSTSYGKCTTSSMTSSGIRPPSSYKASSLKMHLDKHRKTSITSKQSAASSPSSLLSPTTASKAKTRRKVPERLVDKRQFVTTITTKGTFDNIPQVTKIEEVSISESSRDPLGITTKVFTGHDLSSQKLFTDSQIKPPTQIKKPFESKIKTPSKIRHKPSGGELILNVGELKPPTQLKTSSIPSLKSQIPSNYSKDSRMRIEHIEKSSSSFTNIPSDMPTISALKSSPPPIIPSSFGKITESSFSSKIPVTSVQAPRFLTTDPLGLISQTSNVLPRLRITSQQKKQDILPPTRIPKPKTDITVNQSQQPIFQRPIEFERYSISNIFSLNSTTASTTSSIQSTIYNQPNQTGSPLTSISNTSTSANVRISTTTSRISQPTINPERSFQRHFLHHHSNLTFTEGGFTPSSPTHSDSQSTKKNKK